jgi:hypothetical protein
LKLYFTAGFVAMLAVGWIGFPRALYKSARQPLAFNHHLHKDKASQKCTDCHGDNSTPSLASCAGCHAEPMGATADEKILVAAFVKPGREIPWRSYARQPMNVRFPHAVHVNLGRLACDTCHGARGDSTGVSLYQEDRISGYSRHAVSMTMSDCEDCHRRRGVEAGCLGCHK